MKNLIILTLFILAISGCSSSRPDGNTEAEKLFKEAQKFMDKGQYILANEKLNNLRSQYPYSYFATPAELIQADILYKQENFVESAAAYILFRDFHPKHEKVSYVVWMIAESYFNQLPSTFDRDLSQGQEAIKYYQEIIEKYQTSEYLQTSKEKINSINDMVKKRERYIADFYFKTKVFDAARYRYLLILDEIPDADYQDHASIRVIESSIALKEFDACKKYITELRPRVSGNFLESFDSLGKSCNQN